MIHYAGWVRRLPTLLSLPTLTLSLVGSGLVLGGLFVRFSDDPMLGLSFISWVGSNRSTIKLAFEAYRPLFKPCASQIGPS